MVAPGAGLQHSFSAPNRPKARVPAARVPAETDMQRDSRIVPAEGLAVCSLEQPDDQVRRIIAVLRRKNQIAEGPP